MGQASYHYLKAHRSGWEPTHCEGRVRRAFVRLGRRYYVPAGWFCDECDYFAPEPNFKEEVERVKAYATVNESST
jgi:hypothetical protein